MHLCKRFYMKTEMKSVTFFHSKPFPSFSANTFLQGKSSKECNFRQIHRILFPTGKNFPWKHRLFHGTTHVVTEKIMLPHFSTHH